MFVDVYYPQGIAFTDSEVPLPQGTFVTARNADCLIDELLISKETDSDIVSWSGAFEENWDRNTLLHAKFNGNLAAGSIEYAADEVSEIRLKRRIKGDFRWQTIYTQPVESSEDFAFDYYDILNASNEIYEYTLVPVIDSEEGSINTAEVESVFTDFFLCEPDRIFHAIINSENQITYNEETAAQTTIGRKYPYVIKNGDVGYYSGTLSVAWLRPVDCQFDAEGGAKYRREVDQFLTDGKPKILKDWLGNIFMVMVTDAIPQNKGEHYYVPMHQISWVECGDYKRVADLYDNGFIDTDIDRE